MSAALDYLVGGEAGYTGLAGDVADSAAMQPFSASQAQPWWQGVIQYGLTRAIDNRFAPPNVSGNTSPGSFAGQNGRTYSNGQGGTAGAFQLTPLMMLALGAVVVALVVSKG